MTFSLIPWDRSNINKNLLYGMQWWEPLFSLQRHMHSCVKEQCANLAFMEPTFIPLSLWDEQDNIFISLQQSAYRLLNELCATQQTLLSLWTEWPIETKYNLNECTALSDNMHQAARELESAREKMYETLTRKRPESTVKRPGKSVSASADPELSSQAA